MEISLDISRHCIETAARLKLERLIRACIKCPDPVIENQIEVLTDFLKRADFSDLRSQIEKLREPHKFTVSIFFSIDMATISISLVNGSAIFID